MKKKIISILLVFAMLLGASGCMFEFNSDRDLARTVARVGDYNITKMELLAVYANVGATYEEQYGMTTQEVLDYLLDQLVERRILLDYAKTYLPVINTPEPNGVFNSDWEKYLTNSEINAARTETNDAITGQLDSLEETVKKEWGLTEEEEDTDSDTEDEGELDFGYEDKKEWPTPEVEEEEEEEDDAYKIDSITLPTKENKTRYEALERWKGYLEDQHRTVEDVYLNYIENAVLEKLEKVYGENVQVSDVTVEMKYKNMLALNLEKFSDFSAYESAMSGSETVLYHPKYDGGNYVYVKNLLIPFSDEVAADLKLKKNEWTEENYLKYREELAKDIAGKARVNGFEYGEPVSAVDIYNEVVAELNAQTTLEAKTQKFVDLIFKYGTDTGMFNNKTDYLVTPEGRDSSYVEEFTEATRELAKSAGAGAYTELVLTDYGYHIIYISEVIDGGKTYQLDDIYSNTGKTVRSIIHDALLTSRQASEYSDFRIKYVAEQKKADNMVDGKVYVEYFRDIYSDWYE